MSSTDGWMCCCVGPISSEGEGWLLSGQVEADSGLVSSSIEVLCVDQRGEGDLDTIAELGNVGETETKVVVKFHLGKGVSIKSLLCTNGKGGS